MNENKVTEVRLGQAQACWEVHSKGEDWTGGKMESTIPWRHKTEVRNGSSPRGEMGQTE